MPLPKFPCAATIMIAITTNKLTITYKSTKVIDMTRGVRGQGRKGMKGSAEPVSADRIAIDVHTHMFTPGWIDQVRRHGAPDVVMVPTSPRETIEYRGAPIIRLAPEMTDFDMRIASMDGAGIDLAIISLTAPNVYWGDRAVSRDVAQQVNDEFAGAQARYPDRIRWMASLPWQYPDDAVVEAARAKAKGAAGICMLTNIAGRPLTDPAFEPVWAAIEAAALPVFIHPTTPYVDGMGLEGYGLQNSIGFTTDTSLCFARLILDGFLDRFPKLELIACHGGGALPYLAARFDQLWAKTGSVRRIERKPSTYLRRLWFDAIVYDQRTLRFLVDQVGADRVLYGSDYPFMIADPIGVRRRVDALPAAERDAILRENARRLFRLDAGAGATRNLETQTV